MISFWRLGESLNALFADREWSLEFKDFPPPPTIHDIQTPAEMRVSLARILFDAGVLLTPATSQLFLPPLFPIFRYAHLFTATQPDLALPKGIDDLDPDLTGALAKDVAVGVTAVLARRLWGIQHLADVEPLIATKEVSRITPPPDPDYAKTRPDYIGLNTMGEAAFFESKGAVGAPHRLREQRAKGKKQVCNVETKAHPMRPTANRIVVSTNFPIKDQNKSSRATTFLDDPDLPQGREPDAQPSDLLVRHAYAKVLNLAGLSDVALLLILRQPLPEWLRSFDTVRVRGRPFVPVGPFPVGGVVCLEQRVWNTLTTIGAGNLLASIGGALAGIPHDDAEQPETEEAEAPPGRPAVVLNNGAALVGTEALVLRVTEQHRGRVPEW